MKKILLVMFAGCLLLSSCNQKDKRLDEALSKVTSCAELGTVEYSITKLIKANDVAFYKIGDRKIIFSCKATMKAGIDLKDFSAENVKVSDDRKSININLPSPKILALNMNSEGIKVEYSRISGMRDAFNTEERMALLKQGETAILADAESLGILNDAKDNATVFFEALLANCGFESIKVNYIDETKK
ncbi:MAG: DUF4230 domain-containing protein [Bacteroidales bacterium]|nr:DUF4230 domain-containing protein [Bacteroidales bacterium]